jgi:L-fuconolactonase
MRGIDSHQHFWRYNPAAYPWIQPEWPLRRDFLPQDLAPLLQKHQLSGCIAVQARQSMEETRWLLELAGENSFIVGVVGWVDLRSRKVAGDLARVSRDTKLVGIRHVAQDEPDCNFLRRPEFMTGIAALEEFGLAYDLLVYPQQLPAAIALVKEFPRQRFVLDHLAKPRVASGIMEPWASHIRQIAQYPNVYCKVSGLVTEAGWQTWREEELVPYLEVALQAFGEERVLYGSDWPVCLNSASYERMFSVARNFSSKLTARGRERFWRETAIKVYNLSVTI